MKFELCDYFLDLIVNIFKLAVSKFGYFGALSGLIRDFNNVDNFVIWSIFMSNNFRLEIHHFWD